MVTVDFLGGRGGGSALLVTDFRGGRGGGTAFTVSTAAVSTSGTTLGTLIGCVGFEGFGGAFGGGLAALDELCSPKEEDTERTLLTLEPLSPSLLPTQPSPSNPMPVSFPVSTRTTVPTIPLPPISFTSIPLESIQGKSVLLAPPALPTILPPSSVTLQGSISSSSPPFQPPSISAFTALGLQSSLSRPFILLMQGSTSILVTV
mmetsp:Transcript_21056/g.43915  ORF Transcript_21056/g.43915 Transcript_21056/m.43915 type:complete len:204 (+) Transcript_21056:225-836(+)